MECKAAHCRNFHAYVNFSFEMLDIFTEQKSQKVSDIKLRRPSLNLTASSKEETSYKGSLFACFVNWVIPDNGMCIGTQPRTHFNVFNSKLHIQRGQNQEDRVEASESEKNPWLKDELETVVSKMSFLLLFIFLSGMCSYHFCYFHFSIFK